MGDTIEGSSRAAHGAHVSEQDESSGFLTRLFSNRHKSRENRSTAEAVAEAIHHGSLGNLRNLRVEDVAVPRADITAVSNELALGDLVGVFRESGFSRIPVFKDTLDNPLGLIHLKDLALKYGFNGRPKSFDVTPMLRPLLYVPPSMPIGVLLQKMQTERTHMALVIDEYGGVDGLATIEDLIEQVVGEIEDEHDAEEDDFWIEEQPGVYLCQARAPLDEFEKELGADLLNDVDDEDIGSLGGLVFMISGRVPARGEVIRHPKGFEFEIVDADPRRIKRLRVRAASGKG